MKHLLLLPIVAVTLLGCSQATVKKTYVTSTVPYPRSIYIEPFDITQAKYIFDHGMSQGETDLRKGIIPMEFAYILRDQLARIAPTRVLLPGEKAPEGWVMSGEFLLVDGGNRYGRAIPPWGWLGAARSTLVVHVKVRDAKSGEVLYDFDVSGGSGKTAFKGNTGAPGVGPADTFDFRNAAQRIELALSRDPMRYGERSSPAFW